jgi:hypothetical protein
MSQQPTQRQIALLWHTLGLSPEQRQPYRNFFDADPGHHDMPDLEALETAGLMVRSKPPAFVRQDAIFFFVTEEGKALAISKLPEPRKLTRYQQFMDSDCGNTFAEYMGINVPVLEYNRPHGADGYQYRYVRTSYISWDPERIEGEWCSTKKEAKASYKAALKKAKTDKKQFMNSIEANGFLALPDEVAA